MIAEGVRRKDLADEIATAHRIKNEPPAPPFDAGTVAEILARPAGPPMRIEGLIPWEASTLIVAQRKTGKTTTLLNYARSLLLGENFLGAFPVVPLADDACVAFLNYEMGARQLAGWAQKVDVPPERLYVVNLRGQRNPLTHPEDRATLAANLRARNVQSVIIDPFGRAYGGVSQNDNGEVQAFLVDLDMFVRSEVGAPDLMLTAHAGWDGERSRGASALEDWGDTIITLTRDPEDESRRFMKAIGRDVEVDEDELDFDPATHILTRSGNGPREKSRTGGKKIGNETQLALDVVKAVNNAQGTLTRNGVGRAVRELPEMVRSSANQFGAQLLTDAIGMAYATDSITVHKGAGPRRGDVIHRRDLADCTLCKTTVLTVLDKSGTVPQATVPAPYEVGPGTVVRENSQTQGSSEQSVSIVDKATRQRVNPHTGEVVDNSEGRWSR